MTINTDALNKNHRAEFHETKHVDIYGNVSGEKLGA